MVPATHSAAARVASETHPELGLTLSVPSGYEAVPVRARERFCVLSYAAEQTSAERRAGATPATLSVYIVPRGAVGESVVDAASFLRVQLSPVVSEELRPGRDRMGYTPRRWTTVLPGPNGSRQGAYVHAWENPYRAVIIIGRCAPDEYDRQRPGWKRSAENLRLYEPVVQVSARERLERHYANRRLQGVDFRIDVRMNMVEGWDFRDTEHYIILSHGVDDRFVRSVADQVEIIRKEYGKQCPPDQSLDTVSLLRICRDDVEYRNYGGPNGSAGYWSAAEQELVLFDASGVTLPGVDGEHYTRSVLFHEAFHQYLQASLDQIPAHAWYEEGMAEYFGGALMERGRLQRIEPNRYRLSAIQNTLRGGRAQPWQRIIEMDHDAFMTNSNELYAQSWSMVYFLIEAKVVAHHSRWRKILPTYFRTLRQKWIS
ncbi:MAG: DUF1570 domain-containing protein, partial [Planctomycetota bacterium]